jgi:spermidine synthase
LSFWFDENFQDESRFGVKATKMLFEEQSKFQKVSIVETKRFGRVLAIDNIFMTSEFDEYLYHEMIVHPALNTVANPQRVLIIGGGDGGCASEVLSHDAVNQVVMVEIDEVVVEACKRFLPTIGRSWDDPRLEVIIGDGIDYAINAQVEPFDVILLDGSDPVGPATGLFDVGFYRGCERLLASEGVFVLQSESPVLQRETFLEIGRALGGIFPMVYPYFGNVPIYVSGSWSWTYATRSVDPFGIIEDRVARQEKRCRHYNRDIHRAAFAVPNEFKAIFNNGKSKSSL